MLDVNQLRRKVNDKKRLAELLAAGQIDLQRSELRVDINLPRHFDETFVRTLSQWLASEYRDDLYLWFHVDETGDPFYAGRGRGSTAWDWYGGPAWEWFVRERLGGSYQVAILATGLDETQSEMLLEQVYETYADFILNQHNFFRNTTNQGNGTYREQKSRVRPLYNRVAEAHPSEQFELAVEAQRLQYEIVAISNESGRFGQVLCEMNPRSEVDDFFIPYIIDGLLERGRIAEAKDALAEFLARAAQRPKGPKIERLTRLVKRAVRKQPECK